MRAAIATQPNCACPGEHRARLQSDGGRAVPLDSPLVSSCLLIPQTSLCYAKDIMMIRTSDIVSVFFLSR